jgi:hypothetical protein
MKRYSEAKCISLFNLNTIFSFFFTMSCLFTYSHAADSINNDASTGAIISNDLKLNQVSSIKIKKENLIPGIKKFSFYLDLSVDQNLRTDSDPSKDANLSLSFAPSYQLFSKARLISEIHANQNLNSDYLTELANTTLGLSFTPIALSQNNNLLLTVKSILPTNKNDRVKNSFDGALSASAGLNNKASLFTKLSNTTISISALKNMHEFERTADGEANLSTKLSYSILYIQALSQIFSAELYAKYNTGWTYQNDLKTSFSISEKLNLDIKKNISTYIQHSNDGNALQANGSDSNIQIYDKNKSVMSAGLVITY